MLLFSNHFQLQNVLIEILYIGIQIPKIRDALYLERTVIHFLLKLKNQSDTEDFLERYQLSSPWQRYFKYST